MAAGAVSVTVASFVIAEPSVASEAASGTVPALQLAAVAKAPEVGCAQKVAGVPAEAAIVSVMLSPDWLKP